MAWDQLEPTPAHLTYLTISSFLIVYALFSITIRNRLHLSEPPLALLFGIILGPRCLNVLRPYQWGFSDDVVQEYTRLIVGIQCFAVGLELPTGYFRRHWKSVALLLGPVMTFGWLVCAVFIGLIFETDVPSALIIAACLTPTDPVLAASVLSNSQFSTRVPKRIRELLSAESGCNDGISYPFLYIGLSILTRQTAKGMVNKWFLITILWQCICGSLLGLFIGYLANRLYLFSIARSMIGRASYLVFYLLLATFTIGLAATLGMDDFLAAFCAGVSFHHNNNSPTADTRLPVVIDMMLNSTLFIFFGAMIPWMEFAAYDSITPGRLLAALALILLFRRLPIVYILHRVTPSIHTLPEALFVGHFGPMGVGALFLAMEARAQLETNTSIPLPDPPDHLPDEKRRAVMLVWPIICFVVMGSTLVHGLSTLAISVGGHFTRHKHERADAVGAEREGLWGMEFDEEREEEENRTEEGMDAYRDESEEDEEEERMVDRN